MILCKYNQKTKKSVWLTLLWFSIYCNDLEPNSKNFRGLPALWFGKKKKKKEQLGLYEHLILFSFFHNEDFSPRIRMSPLLYWLNSSVPSDHQSLFIIFPDVLRKPSFAVLKWVKSLSRVWLFATPWTVAYQAPPSMGFSRQAYWSGVPFPSPGDLPHPGTEPGSPAL